MYTLKIRGVLQLIESTYSVSSCIVYPSLLHSLAQCFSTVGSRSKTGVLFLWNGIEGFANKLASFLIYNCLEVF